MKRNGTDGWLPSVRPAVSDCVRAYPIGQQDIRRHEVPIGWATHAPKERSDARWFDPHGDQLPGPDFHLRSKYLQWFLTQVATPDFDGQILRPTQLGLAVFTGRSEQANDPCIAIIAGFAF